MHDLIEFLRARYDDRARITNACRHKSWTLDGDSIVGDHPTDEIVDWVYDEGAWEHIAANDPKSALADIDAKLRILDEYAAALDRRARHPEDMASAGALLQTVRVVKLLALRYADHPDYRPEWRPA